MPILFQEGSSETPTKYPSRIASAIPRGSRASPIKETLIPAFFISPTWKFTVSVPRAMITVSAPTRLLLPLRTSSPITSPAFTCFIRKFGTILTP